METCKERSVVWAVFSDKYGVWFCDVEHEWYEKDPDSVSEEEFIRLLHDFDTKLEGFAEIWFYYNPGRFHPLYARLLEETKLRDKIRKFSHLMQIGKERPEMNGEPVKGMKHSDSQTGYRRAKIGRAEAARTLNRLQICKAYGPTGKINGPNCERFGHRDVQSGKWYWDVDELIQEARRRSSASPEVIRQVEELYSLSGDSPIQEPGSDRPAKQSTRSRADLEKWFRDTIVGLERAMRERMPWSQAGRDLRTLGSLIHEAEEKQVLGRIRLKEARLVNEVRNAQNHPTTEQISDEDLTRAIQSARAIIAAIEKH